MILKSPPAAFGFAATPVTVSFSEAFFFLLHADSWWVSLEWTDTVIVFLPSCSEVLTLSFFPSFPYLLDLLSVRH